MEKPKEYNVEYVAVQDVPYKASDPSAEGTHASQGTCHEGRVVFLTKAIPASTSDLDVTAWVEGAGIVVLKTRFLSPCQPPC
jgi:hypothetical protein